jgi:hypothetical protein
MRATSLDARPGAKRVGVTLVEVLVAIFITGVGLLALLTLFPLGAAEMAQSIQDDRAGHVKQDADALSVAGQDLLSRTGQFVVASLFTGSANPKTAGELREEYEKLAVKAAELEARIRELRPLAPNPKVTRQVDRLIAQSLAIKRSLDHLAELFRMLENGL